MLACDLVVNGMDDGLINPIDLYLPEPTALHLVYSLPASFFGASDSWTRIDAHRFPACSRGQKALEWYAWSGDVSDWLQALVVLCDGSSKGAEGPG